jgi:ribosomal protein L37AE/L43A
MRTLRSELIEKGLVKDSSKKKKWTAEQEISAHLSGEIQGYHLMIPKPKGKGRIVKRTGRHGKVKEISIRKVNLNTTGANILRIFWESPKESFTRDQVAKRLRTVMDNVVPTGTLAAVLARSLRYKVLLNLGPIEGSRISHYQFNEGLYEEFGLKVPLEKVYEVFLDGEADLRRNGKLLRKKTPAPEKEVESPKLCPRCHKPLTTTETDGLWCDNGCYESEAAVWNAIQESIKKDIQMELEPEREKQIQEFLKLLPGLSISEAWLSDGKDRTITIIAGKSGPGVQKVALQIKIYDIQGEVTRKEFL